MSRPSFVVSEIFCATAAHYLSERPMCVFADVYGRLHVSGANR